MQEHNTLTTTTFPTDVMVDSIHGPVMLSDMFATGPIVVAFHRLGCPLSERAARRLAAAEYQFDAAGTRVVIVYRDGLEAVERSRSEREIPFDCVSDPHRALETAAGLDSSDVVPDPATFVVDRDVRLVYSHHSGTADDIAPVDDVLDAIRTAASGWRRRGTLRS
jgi:peroxiredoxin